MIDFIVTYWREILFCCLVVLVTVYGCMTGKVKEWLKYAVTVCEQELGTGTGQLKLAECYSMFITAFPVFAKLVPFVVFSKWVDLSLEWLKVQLESNENLKRVVEQ